MANLRRRVKLYALSSESQWEDHGTGHISTIFMDHDKQGNSIMLQVRSEDDGKILLQSNISTDIEYKKQQETILIWNEDERNLALSFQRPEGCNDIWEKICQVQGKHDSAFETGNEMSEYEEEPYEEPVQDFCLPVKLPPVELSKLDEISEFLHDYLASAEGREKLATAIEQESYIKDLIDVFHMCEDLENIDGLHTLFEIMKTLFLLEKNSLFEIMFLPENLMDIVGMLEFDPNKKEPVKHREFLTKKVVFKEVIPIANPELIEKIHQTYRLQYIKDILVPVPSLFDENMSTLSSFLFFRKIEIVTLIQEDPQFLTELFGKLTDDEISDDKRKEAVLLLRELCNFSQTLRQENRNDFIKTLSENDLLVCMEQLLNLDDMEMKSIIIDVISCVVEFNPSLVREYICKQANSVDEDSLLLNTLIDLLLTGSETGLDIILLQLIRSLLDPENMGLGINKMEKSEFLGFFYRHCVHVLVAPIYACTSTGKLSGKDDYKRATTLDHIVDLLTFCVLHHNYNMRSYLLGKDLIKRVLVLLQSRHKFLALAALRFLRRVISLKDEFYYRFIKVEKLLKPVVDAFKTNGSRYNLLNSAIIDLFEFIKTEDIKILCAYIVENHLEELSSVTYVDTFAGLKLKYEQEQDRIANANAAKENIGGIIHTNNSIRRRRDNKTLDEEEETWFDLEDEEMGTPPLANDSSNESLSTKPLSAKLKDVDLLDNLPLRNDSNRPGSPQNNIRPGSPQNNIRPSSPQNNGKLPTQPNSRPSSPQNNLHPISPQKKLRIGNDDDSVIPTYKPGNSPVANKTFFNSQKTPINRVNKQIPGTLNKPVINIKINSGNINSSISKLEKVEDEKLENYKHLENGLDGNHVADSVKNDSNGKTPVREVLKTQQVSAVITTKPTLTSLVDYPDDDEENNTDDEEVPSSPAKKQRVSTT